MKKWLILGILCLGVSLVARAQIGPLIGLTPTDTMASTFSCAAAAAINTQNTCTINVGANLHAYINFLLVGACADNTTNAVSTPQIAFTSTNLNGWQQQLTLMQGATIGTTGPYPGNCIYVGGARTHPLTSVQGPATVTIVSPAAQAHSSYPLNVEYYIAQ